MRIRRRQLVELAALLFAALVLAACGGGGGGGSPAPFVPSPLAVATASLPNGTRNVAYNQTLQATGGSPPYSWSLAPGSGSLPPGLALSSVGVISGTPTEAGAFSFSVQATDSASRTATRALSIRIPGRNDTLAAATPLSNGDHLASISPYSDPPATANPDQDFYRINVAAGATVTIEIRAQRDLGTFLDSVLEIQDSNGIRLNTCRALGASGLFNQPCMNDDLAGTLDSGLEFQNAGSSAVTIFVRVLDFRGDARPDLRYRLLISGAL